MQIKFEDLYNIISIYGARNNTFLELYKNFLMYIKDREVFLYQEGKQWMANIKNPITYVIVSTIYGMYLDNSVAFEVYKQVRKFKGLDLEQGVVDNLPPDLQEQAKNLEEENKKKDEYVQLILDLLEYIYSEQNADSVLDEIALHAIITGTGYGGIEYLKYEEEYEYITPGGGRKKYVELVDTPNIYSINPLNFFPSWSRDGVKKNSKYDIVRKIMSENTFQKTYSVYNIELKKKKIEEEGKILIKKDWDMVIRNMLFNNMPGSTWGGNDAWTGGVSTPTDITTDNSFQIGGDLYEVYEVHTDYTVQIFVNGIDHGVYPRLGPWKKRPFFKIKFKRSLDPEHGIGAAYIAFPFQRVADQFLNLRLDTDRIAASQPIAVSSDESFFDGMDHLEMYPGKLIKLHDPQRGIVPLQTVQPGTVANQEVDLLTNTIKEALGLSGYAIGTQNKIERSARGVQELINAAQRSIKDFVKSISEAMSFVSKYLVILAVEYMDNEVMKRILGTDKLKELSIEDLIKDYVVSFDMQPLKTSTDMIESDILRRFIQESAGLTRPNGTPLLDQEAAYKMLLDKLNLPEDLLLTNEEAIEYQKQQIEDQAAIEQYRQQVLGPMANAVENQQQGQIQQASGLTQPIPGVQGGQTNPQIANVTNPEGNNQPQQLV